MADLFWLTKAQIWWIADGRGRPVVLLLPEGR
ncbi:hypothetical protein FHS87_001874 [Roseomonas pecuniae]|uniref:Uncharacterized protein n=1 Tax=Muricoccus pecuniae TaxID=693023 RepID=A0A840YBV1_9PROT|nr:hypothetical protein [Roseomonas pecuniae]